MMCHVLIIEDNWAVAELMSDVLIEAGAASVEVVDTEQRAIDAAQKQAPCLILSDVKLAKGTGPGAIESIRAAHGPVPVVCITGADDGCHVDQPSIMLRKPVHARTVVDAVQKLVNFEHEA